MMGTSDARTLILVLASRRSFEALVGPVPRTLRRRFRFEKARHTKRIEALLPRCRLVVSKSYLRPATNRWIFEARRAGVPTLLLVDGPLEWSNLHKNPRLGALGPAATGLYEPIFHDAVATIGAAQRDWIAARNSGRSILFSTYANRRILSELRATANADPAFDFLLATARTPHFDEAERDALGRALEIIARAIERAGHRALVRVTDDALRARVLRAAPSARIDRSSHFAAALARTRCVIGTPSSILLEAMHHDRPTALLQFRSTPLFYACGWQVDAHTRWEETFRTMLAKDADRMARQRESLRENCSDEDFFTFCDAIVRGDVLEKPRPLDALDLRFESTTQRTPAA